MSGETADLERLAERAGIHLHYWDIFGQGHRTSPDTQRALLSAMGFEVDTSSEVRDSLQAFEETERQRVLTPVTVLRRDRQAASIIVNAPAAGTFGWELILETGDTMSGDSRHDDLPAASDDGPGRLLSLPPDMPDGYHRLHVNAGGERAEAAVIVAPPVAYLPDWLGAGQRRWGLACHLYSLRSSGDWGIGDISGLARLMDTADTLGAAVVGINPLHAPFGRHPESASPYSPSSRNFLNPLYIDVAGIPFLDACPNAQSILGENAFAAQLAAARSDRHVDYAGVSALKHSVLRAAYEDFCRSPGDHRRAFEDFRSAGGEGLTRFCLFETLHDHFDGAPWSEWPAAYRSPSGPAVDAFAVEQAERVGYHAFLQWLADTQLTSATDGREACLYRDLATGVDPNGADAWADPEATARGVTFGAPPDAFNDHGQDWGMPPPNPHVMKERAFAPFARLLRANMRHAGALRIDHALGLMRLFWVPDGARPTEGAYVSYPDADLAGVLALESHRNRCLIVGEDLGTVPDEFLAYMDREKFLSYRVFYFERWPEGLFKRPDAYPDLSLATATTHDLPTLAGYWSGDDLILRDRLGLNGGEDLVTAETARAADRKVLIAALRDQELPVAALRPDGSVDDGALKSFITAVERYLARSRAGLMMVNLDDLLMELEQLNLPGTVEEYPNWRRRLAAAVEDMTADPDIADILRAVAEERPL